MTAVIQADDTAVGTSPTPSAAAGLTLPASEANTSTSTSGVSYRSLLLFYLPLAFSGLMMTLDLPVVNAMLNRLPNPDVSVAALRVAFSMALVYEASHISMIDASTTLSADMRTFRILRRFYVVMSATLLVIASILVFSPFYDWIVRDVMNQTRDVAEAARPAVWAFLLWPIPIGWRRLYQGALIKHGHPKPVGAGGLVRMSSLFISLLFFGWLGTSVIHIEPSAIAVLAMLVSVTAEAAAVHGWTGRILRSMPESIPGKPAPTYRDLWRFIFPLSGTSIMSTLVQPVVTGGIATAAIAWASPNGSVVAVASYAIAWSMAFLVFGPTLSMTQASIAWSSNPNPQVRERGPRVILTFGVGLALLDGGGHIYPLRLLALHSPPRHPTHDRISGSERSALAHPHAYPPLHFFHAARNAHSTPQARPRSHGPILRPGRDSRYHRPRHRTLRNPLPGCPRRSPRRHRLQLHAGSRHNDPFLEPAPPETPGEQSVVGSR